MQKSAKM